MSLNKSMHAPVEDTRMLSEGRPWWRHRWPWLLLLGPAVAVVACVITIVLAFQAYGGQEIHDGGVRQGLVVTPPVQDAR